MKTITSDIHNNIKSKAILNAAFCSERVEKAFVVICINFVLAAILYLWHCWGGGKEEGGRERGGGGRGGREGGREGGEERRKGGTKGESEGRREGGRRGGVKIIFVFDNFLMQLDSKGSVSGSYS